MDPINAVGAEKVLHEAKPVVYVDASVAHAADGREEGLEPPMRSAGLV